MCLSVNVLSRNHTHTPTYHAHIQSDQCGASRGPGGDAAGHRRSTHRHHHRGVSSVLQECLLAVTPINLPSPFTLPLAPLVTPQVAGAPEGFDQAAQDPRGLRVCGRQHDGRDDGTPAAGRSHPSLTSLSLASLSCLSLLSLTYAFGGCLSHIMNYGITQSELRCTCTAPL
jgi:hypothetical protein